MALADLGKEYDFLVSKPVYQFDYLRGFYKESKYSDICRELKGNSEYINKNTCINLFGILDNVFNRGLLGSNKQIFSNFYKWFNINTGNLDLTSDFMRDLMYYFSSFVKESINSNFKTYSESYANSTELKDITKLFYFTQNVGNIKEGVENVDGPNYRKYLKFINECLNIYRKYKNTKCSEKYPYTFTGSTICFEVDSFFNSYESILFPTLRYMSKVKTKNASPNDVISYSAHEDKYPMIISSIFGERSSELSTISSASIIGFSIFGFVLILFMLYKFTPLGSRINPRMKRTRRIWRDIESDYVQQLHQDDNVQEENVRRRN
ncbi:PIR Superfamily Protein [Plasmodium ovale curtisi]|uniref:PIR Superfamily Protein n=1 Tax=Plasmodium ovale curtisi TaxID=864141 RepID=A0A1A8XDU4_PLAOA|nr:PIR Superfamily Protein [Plasmodium ovale curtisi]